MKTTFIHPRKKQALLAFVVACACFFGLCVAWRLDPDAKSVWILYILVVLPFAGFFGCRAFFCSDEWHVMKMKEEHNEDYWLENHPRIRFVLAVIPLLMAAFFMMKEFLPHFLKH